MGSGIVVVGSLNLDLVVRVSRLPMPGETTLGGDVARYPGGKGANQAVAAARLGQPVSMVGRVGDDDGGRLLLDALASDGVDARSVRLTPGVPSGTALITVDDRGENVIVVSPGANARVSVDDVRASAATLADADAALLQLEIPLEAVAEAARSCGGAVILNPAPAASVPAEVLELVDVLVPNRPELSRLAGREVGGPDDVVAAAHEVGVERVIVTLGEEGAIVVEGGEATPLPATRVAPVDSTAAGDSFCAAVADALVRGASLVEAAEWAVRAAAVTVTRAGAQTSLPTRDEVAAVGTAREAAP
jgi:ribokinase